MSFPGSQHVSELNLTTEDDEVVWKYAADHGFAILSKDSDFFHRALLRGHPPKFIHVRVGNCSTQRIRDLLADNVSLIQQFLSDPVESLLILE